VRNTLVWAANLLTCVQPAFALIGPATLDAGQCAESATMGYRAPINGLTLVAISWVRKDPPAAVAVFTQDDARSPRVSAEDRHVSMAAHDGAGPVLPTPARPVLADRAATVWESRGSRGWPPWLSWPLVPLRS
jgi:hypothetical protein